MDFYKNLLKSDGSDKSTDILIPPSTIEKTWSVSPTLQSPLDLLENWLHTHWANGDMKKEPIGGGWILLFGV